MFTTLCRMSQPKLKKFVATKLKETHNKIIVEDGFVYAQGNFPVLLVAHLDTVHKQLPLQIYYDNNKDALSSPQGIGGDDRCGVYMILEIIQKYNCSVLFCEDEESGCVGAKKFTQSKLAKDLFNQFNYIIEFDRMGSNDAVFYECENDEFEEFITKEHFKFAIGSFSDISVIAPALGCAAVNFSCGYYNPHTTDEYVIVSEMDENIKQACKILDRTTEKDKFEYIEITYSDPLFRFNSDYDFDDTYNSKAFFIEWYDEKEGDYCYEEMYAFTEVEAVGEFLMAHPTLAYKDIHVYDLD